MLTQNPVAIVDMATGQPRAVAGEAGPEQINVTPLNGSQGGGQGFGGQSLQQQVSQQLPPLNTQSLPPLNTQSLGAMPSFQAVPARVLAQMGVRPSGNLPMDQQLAMSLLQERARLEQAGTSTLLAQELVRSRAATPQGKQELLTANMGGIGGLR